MRKLNQKEKDLFHFLTGWVEASGYTLGAWQAVIMEGVEAFNEEEGTKFDPHEGFMIYVENG